MMLLPDATKLPTVPHRLMTVLVHAVDCYGSQCLGYRCMATILKISVQLIRDLILMGKIAIPIRSTMGIRCQNRAFDGRLRATFSYFDLTKQNLSTPDPLNPFRSKAIGEAQTRGYEFDVAGEILPGWNMIATYSYLPYAKITKDHGTIFDDQGNAVGTDDGTRGNRLFLAAKHTVGAYGIFMNFVMNRYVD